MFDYLRQVGYVGPELEGEESEKKSQTNGGFGQQDTKVKICVIDADDLLDHPNEVIEVFCKNVGVDYSPKMLDWSGDEDKEVEKAFEKWKGFHEDAIHSSDLKPRQHVSLEDLHHVT